MIFLRRLIHCNGIIIGRCKSFAAALRVYRTAYAVRLSVDRARDVLPRGLRHRLIPVSIAAVSGPEARYIKSKEKREKFWAASAQ